ncbi:MAG TPA: acyl-CoA thioesterase [Crocinitomix sp.]|nr:acyl-CoA thioesterase [Crocinitomix sp.]
MYTHEHKVRIRYAETDQMGYCYYGNYPQFYEIGRVETLRSIGTSYKEIEKKGFILPVANLTAKYLKPALYDDLITIKTIVKNKPTVKIEFDYEIYNEKGELLNIGYTKLVFVNNQTMRPCFCPDFLTNLFAKYF